MKHRIPIIDAGHGRYTPIDAKRYTFTNTNGGDYTVYEGNINRNIAERLCRLLNNEGIPYKYLNVDDDTDFSLKNRTDIINQLYMDNEMFYLLSIHSNAVSNSITGSGSRAAGMEIWTSLGETISDNLVPYIEASRVVNFPNRILRHGYLPGELDKEANFWMLKKSNCPAVLVEMGFFDNLDEVNDILDSPAGIDRCALLLFDAVKNIYNSDL